MLKKIANQAPVIIFLILGMWLVILKPLGPHLALVPGNLGDARFNNYVLEHFFDWAAGLTKNYWNAPFFYPYPQTMAFSDNLLGSAPFYALFRWAGLDRESAYQGWYILGYILNFTAAYYVLWRLGFKSLAAGFGAFFFTFGLPLLAQESHAQLLYRFGIPLASYFLWRFFQSPRLWNLILMATFLAWQFFLSIYMGVFLLFLLVVLIILLPFHISGQAFWQRLAIWPRCLIQAWSLARLPERIIAGIAVAVLGLGLGAMLAPYYQVTKVYSFPRNWADISIMLPRWKSYLLAGSSLLWRINGSFFSSLPVVWEQNLFPGLSIVLALLTGISMRFQTENRRLAWLHFDAALVLVAFTLDIHGFSFYRLVYQLPGINSIRAITRIMLVIMWPLALFATWAMDGFLQRFADRHRWMQGFAYMVAVLMVCESALFSHTTYVKAAEQAHLEALRKQIPAKVPANPILYFAWNLQSPYWTKEIDAMLVAQELGWPTLNGYSGNAPKGYWYADTCRQLPEDIMNYMNFARIDSPAYYLAMIKRTVPIGFSDCDPSWWTNEPSISYSSGPFAAEIFADLALKVISLKSGDTMTTAQVEITNNSSLPIPAHSSSGNPFELSWRFIGAEDQKPLSTFYTRKGLDFDIPAHGTTLETIEITPPNQAGRYKLEVTAVQELVAWFYERGTAMAESGQQLYVNSQGKVKVRKGISP